MNVNCGNFKILTDTVLQTTTVFLNLNLVCTLLLNTCIDTDTSLHTSIASPLQYIECSYFLKTLL